MQEIKFTCDCCGRKLDRHGQRYLVTISEVPAYRGEDRIRFDLCAICAAELKAYFNRGDK